jgi:hypothetical protein
VREYALHPETLVDIEEIWHYVVSNSVDGVNRAIKPLSTTWPVSRRHLNEGILAATSRRRRSCSVGCTAT